MKRAISFLCALVIAFSFSQKVFANRLLGDVDTNYIRVMGCLCAENDSNLGVVSFLGTTLKEKEKNLVNVVGLEPKVIKTEFTQAYLIVPKYKGTEIIIKKISYKKDRDGVSKAVYKGTLATETNKAILLYCNTNNRKPNVEVTLKYKNNLVKFTPNINLKTGSPMLPKELMDSTTWVHFA